MKKYFYPVAAEHVETTLAQGINVPQPPHPPIVHAFTTPGAATRAARSLYGDDFTLLEITGEHHVHKRTSDGILLASDIPPEFLKHFALPQPPCTIEVKKVRSRKKAEYRDGHFEIPVLFTMRGLGSDGRSVQWIETSTIRVPTMDSNPCHIIRLDGVSWGHKPAETATFYEAGGRHFIDWIDHPMAHYVRTQVYSQDAVARFAAILGWRDHDFKNRRNIHPINLLASTFDTVPDDMTWDSSCGIFSDLSFDGRRYGHDEDSSPLYQDFETATAAVGAIETRFSRKEVLTAVSDMGSRFALTEDRVLVSVNEPKIEVRRDPRGSNSKVITRVSVREGAQAFPSVWFPLNKWDEASAFAENLAFILGSEHSDRRCLPLLLGPTDENRILRRGIENLAYGFVGRWGRSEGFLRFIHELSPLADDEFLSKIQDALDEGAISSTLARIDQQDCTLEYRNAVVFAASAMRLLAQKPDLSMSDDEVAETTAAPAR